MRLNDDALCLIFVALDQLDRKTLLGAIPAVCRRWREVCRLRMRVDISVAMHWDDAVEIPAFVAATHAFVGRFDLVRAFALRMHMNVTEESMATVAAGCPSVTALDLSECDKVQAVLQQWHGPRLSSLNLSHAGLTDAGLETIAARYPNLTELNLRGCWKLTDLGVEKIAAGCPRLTRLNLAGCRRVTDAGVEKIKAGCPRLTKLGR